MIHEPLRYAHEEGHTDVCFSSDGSKFVTCGTDGDIRIWSTEDGSDPTHACIGDWSLSVRQKGANLYVATANNEVQILTFPEAERNGILDRFVAPINQIYISRNSEHIALAGEDMEVKLYDLETNTNCVFGGMTGPCLSVAATSKFVAASSGDGKLRIWDHTTKDLKKEVACFLKVNSFANADTLCRIDFSPDGKLLAYPDKETIVLLNTSGWSEAGILKCTEVSDNYSVVQFSPCGNYLVAITAKGDFIVFHVTMKTVRGKSKHPNSTTVCGLMWNPTGNGQIVYTDTQGQLGIISQCTSANAADDEIFTDNPVDFGDVQFETDDEDGENVISVEKIKKQVMGDTEEPELIFDGSSAAPTPRPRTPEVPLQPPFMPTSTPEHLNPRYMCWNEIGIIRSYGGMTDEESGKSIEIEFHDSTFHNSMMLQNYQDYIMGSVSRAAVAVANSKQIYVIPLKATSKEWVLKLDETDDASEEILLIATSEDLICFGMNNYLVRVCSIFGTQRAVVSIPGPLVTMAAFENVLLVAYHSGAVRNSDQCISMKIIKFTGLAVESRDFSCALSPETTLSWLGFTDRGTPAIMDSLGMLSVHPHSCNVWIPACKTSKHLKSPCDGFFVTAIIESLQTVFGIKCRGSVYPSFTPIPTVCELNMEPPFIEPGTDKTQLEMNLFTWSNLQVSNVDKKLAETALKAFALACKNNLDQRAVELMEIVGNPQLLNLSTKYAVKMHKKLLADKLMELAAKLVNDDDTNSDRFPEITPSPVLSSRKISIKKTPKNKPLPPKEVSASATPLVPSNEVLEHSHLSSFDSSVTMNESVSEERKNPFSISENKDEDANNPLSLINKYAGLNFNNQKENKAKNGTGSEKRKQPESSEPDKNREKQRKLDRFLFTKRT